MSLFDRADVNPRVWGRGKLDMSWRDRQHELNVNWIEIILTRSQSDCLSPIFYISSSAELRESGDYSAVRRSCSSYIWREGGGREGDI